MHMLLLLGLDLVVRGARLTKVKVQDVVIVLFVTKLEVVQL